MKILLITSLLIASSAIAEPVCEKWRRECHQPSYHNYCAGWTDKCVKWHETPTPTPEEKCFPWIPDGPGRCKEPTPTECVKCPWEFMLHDKDRRLIVSSKSDAEALKALGLKMCEGK